MVQPGQTFMPSEDNNQNDDAQQSSPNPISQPPQMPTPGGQPPVYKPAPEPTVPPSPIDNMTPPPAEPPASAPIQPAAGSPPEAAPADNAPADLNTTPAQEQAPSTPSRQDVSPLPVAPPQGGAGVDDQANFNNRSGFDNEPADQVPPAQTPPPPPPVVPPLGPVSPPASEDVSPQPVNDPNQPNPQDLESGNQNDQPPPPSGGFSPPPAGPTSPPSGGAAPPPPPDSANPAVADWQPSLINWQASEYIQHHHSLLWYVGLLAATLGLMAILGLLLKEWLSAVVIGLMATALVVYSRRKPRVLNYAISDTGITIEGKFFPYNQFHGFALVSGASLPTIELDPIKRFMPRIPLFLDKGAANKVSDLLQRHLAREERKPDLIDRLSHALKF